MRKGVLMADNEPTDEELAELMHEVAAEAKERATIAHQKLHDNIRLMIEKEVQKNKCS